VSHLKITIIGAGIAGLSAAIALSAKATMSRFMREGKTPMRRVEAGFRFSLLEYRY
jgi:thioredoxin reductase